MRYLMLVFVLISTGCAERQAQVAVQSSLTILATGVAQADEEVRDRISDAGNVARTKVVAERQGSNLEQMLSFYDQEMQPWTTAVERLEEVRAILQLGQVSVNMWIATGDMGDGWGRFCNVAAEQFELMFAAIRDVAEDSIPPELTNAGSIVGTVCRMAEGYLGRSE